MKRRGEWPRGLTWSREAGFTYTLEAKYRLRFTASHQPDTTFWPTDTDPVPLTSDVLAKITNDGRVHLWRSNTLTIFDAEKGEMEFYEAVTREEIVFEWMEVFFPKRIVAEEVGDAMEQISRWRRDPACKHLRAKIAVKTVSTIVVLALNTIRFVVSSFAGRKAE